MRFATRRLPAADHVIAPDGSEVRVLVGLAGGGLAHFRLNPDAVSVAVHHRSVEEIWYVVSGRGQMWRRSEEDEEVVVLSTRGGVDDPGGHPLSVSASVRTRWTSSASPCRPGRAGARRSGRKGRGRRRSPPDRGWRARRLKAFGGGSPAQAPSPDPPSLCRMSRITRYPAKRFGQARLGRPRVRRGPGSATGLAGPRPAPAPRQSVPRLRPWAGRAAAGETRTDRPETWRLSALDRYVFDLRGYLVFEHALDPGTVERLRSVIDAQGLPPPDETIERQRFGQGGQLVLVGPGLL